MLAACCAKLLVRRAGAAPALASVPSAAACVFVALARRWSRKLVRRSDDGCEDGRLSSDDGCEDGRFDEGTRFDEGWRDGAKPMACAWVSGLPA